MYYDYHMHSNFSADSQTDMEDMVKKSIDLGLKEICFTDHVDYDVISDIEFETDYNTYFKNIENLKNKYSDKVTIKKGIEMGLQPHIIKKCSNDVKNYHFDFVICSMHAIDKIDLYNGTFFNNKTQLQAYNKYYETLYEIVKNYDDYSVLGHLDLIKRYGDYKCELDDKLFYEIIEAILKEAINKGKGIEINTSCFRYGLKDLTPSSNILKLYKDLGGKIITTGSDSHMPSQIAYKFDYIYKKLNDFGFKYITTFDSMKPKFINIENLI
ncbi:HisJ family histidinol phosphate phosphatase [[Clostridium] sordellii]|uniref:histidinol-phosphatase HisJ family protein n=1 Tax=Paraclostridium sordellii TaxID=1505 RepID=UPI0005E9E4C9|nr:histidinol-phosphatase HisJ family protein [Paeniclostridium sordellii]MBX9180794.1 histidinol-phosphatase HisJ family protein [Paeniclostridium sordellii]CEO08713.1 HisJ family histidinol phosphate phosphatase [[Clostridium] sordellii] [Paeniclostridium sordellii]CEP84865.1 HisJ family histidinol phosphate phosphatase [[Clostridium] sordellii] [Paeniclostridium sordellii]